MRGRWLSGFGGQIPGTKRRTKVKHLRRGGAEKIKWSHCALQPPSQSERSARGLLGSREGVKWSEPPYRVLLSYEVLPRQGL